MSNIDYTCKNKKVSPFQTYYYHVMDGDLWAEIFKRLPIKSLCRFRSVCKWWNSLISSAFFINLHLSFNSSTIPVNLKPYLHVADRRIEKIDLSYLANLCHKCYTLCRPLDDVKHIEQKLHFPFRADRENGIKILTFVDVIHGVLCISYSWFPSHKCPPLPCFNSTFLWNPTIHKYVALPCLKLPSVHHAIGFGYEPNRNDFKVVLMDIRSSTYQVYSSRQGIWKTITSHGIRLESSLYFIAKARPIFVNGTIHWILSSQIPNSREWRHFMLMFDCESEEFQRIDLPKKLHSGKRTSVELFEYAGMLAALVNKGSRADLWVMEEHGVSTSWKKLYMLITMAYSMNDDINYDMNDTIRCDPSFEKLSPYGPNNPWNKYHRGFIMYRRYTDHVYEETMFLMDHPEAQSYTTKEVITILTEDPN